MEKKSEKNQKVEKKVSKQKREASEFGKFAEELTRDYILKQGFAITDCNWRFGNHIEIDLISIQGDEIAFIEVKARNGRYQNAEDAIDLKKMKQLVKGADIYLQTQKYDYTARFDVALLEGDMNDYEFTYLKDAFIPPLNAR